MAGGLLRQPVDVRLVDSKGVDVLIHSLFRGLVPMLHPGRGQAKTVAGLQAARVSKIQYLIT